MPDWQDADYRLIYYNTRGNLQHRKSLIICTTLPIKLRIVLDTNSRTTHNNNV